MTLSNSQIMTYINRPQSKYLSDPFEPLRQASFQREKAVLSKAVFVDRDGTLNVEDGYITDPSIILLYSDTSAVLKKFSLQGYLVIIISNQSAIGRELMTEDQFESVNQALWDQLRQSNSGYDALYFCPHTPDDECECRKPKPGLILQAAVDFDIDLSTSYMIGDKLSDIEAGQRAGCNTVLVLTGKGAEVKEMIERDRLLTQPDTIQASLSDALAWIIEHEAA